MGSAVPTALQMAETFGEDVQVILVECQGSSIDEVERFALGKKWVSDHVIWTSEAPFSTGKRTIPCTVVLGVEGDVLFNDNPLSGHATMEELIKAQLKLSRKGPKGLTPALEKVYADFAKGSFGAAMSALEAISQGSDQEAARQLMNDLAQRTDARFARLEWLIANGQFDDADKLAESLKKGSAGSERYVTRAQELASRLTAQEMATEREAAKLFAKIRKKIAADGVGDAKKQLQGLQQKYPETAAAKRASHWLEILGS